MEEPRTGAQCWKERLKQKRNEGPALPEEARPLWDLGAVYGKKFGHNSADDQESPKG